VNDFQRIVDAHCNEYSGVLPSDPEALRTWLLALAKRGYDCGRRAYHDVQSKDAIRKQEQAKR
jgi:hypothetical protein